MHGFANMTWYICIRLSKYEKQSTNVLLLVFSCRPVIVLLPPGTCEVQ